MDKQEELQEYYKQSKKDSEELKGIGGWLILLLIGRFASAFMETSALFQYIAQARGAFFSDTELALYIISVAIILGHIGLEAAIIALIFLKKMAFRTVFLVMVGYILLVSIGYPLILSGVLGTHYTFNPSSIVFFVAAIPWTIYLFLSKRVKNTFHTKPKKAKAEEDTLGWHFPPGG